MIHPCCHARIWSKKCQFCQNYIKLWTKKVYRMPFFPISHKKSLLSFPYFVKKRPFSENKLLLCQYWGKKHQFFQKQGDLILFVFNFSRKTCCCHVHIWSKKRQLCQNYTIFCVQKSNRMPFFSDFSRKNNCSYTHVFSKNVYSLWKHNIPMPIICRKSPFSRKHFAHIKFFLIVGSVAIR